MTVSFGATVPSATRAMVNAVVTTADSIAPSNTMVLSGPANPGLVMAVNGQGDALFVDQAQSGQPSVLDGVHTATALIHLFMIATIADGASETVVLSAIQSDPRLGALASTVERIAATGQSPLRSPDVAAQVLPIVSDLQRTIHAPARSVAPAAVRSPVGKAARDLRINGVPVYVDVDPARSGAYQLTNNGWIPFAASASSAITGNEVGSAELPERDLSLASLTPAFGAPTKTSMQGAPEPLNPTIFQILQSNETRDRTLLRAAEKLFAIALKAIGISPSEDFVSTAMANLFQPSVLAGLRTATPREAVVSILNAFVGAAPSLVHDIIIEQLAKGALAKTAGLLILKNVFAFVEALDAAFAFVQAEYFFADWIKYFDASGSIRVCQDKGALVECIDAVKVQPSDATMTVGDTRVFTAVATSPSGSVVSRPIQWASSDQSVATVDQNGTVTAIGPGSVRIAAIVAGVSGISTVAVIAKSPALSDHFSPSTLTLNVGDSVRVRLLDSKGALVTTVGFYLASPSSAVLVDQTTGSTPGTVLLVGSSAGTATVITNLGPSLSLPVTVKNDNILGTWTGTTGRDLNNNPCALPCTISRGPADSVTVLDRIEEHYNRDGTWSELQAGRHVAPNGGSRTLEGTISGTFTTYGFFTVTVPGGDVVDSVGAEIHMTMTGGSTGTAHISNGTLVMGDWRFAHTGGALDRGIGAPPLTPLPDRAEKPKQSRASPAHSH